MRAARRHTAERYMREREAIQQFNADAGTQENKAKLGKIRW